MTAGSATTIRFLPDVTRQAAYGAWAFARDDILATSRRGEEPRSLQPPIPKAMREAASLLRRTPPPPGMSQDAVDEAIEAVEAPYGPRILRIFREAVASGATDLERAATVLTLVRELGLRPAPVPEPLPVINLDDIHLVCWMALVNDGSSNQA